MIFKSELFFLHIFLPEYGSKAHRQLKIPAGVPFSAAKNIKNGVKKGERLIFCNFRQSKVDNIDNMYCSPVVRQQYSQSSGRRKQICAARDRSRVPGEFTLPRIPQIRFYFFKFGAECQCTCRHYHDRFLSAVPAVIYHTSAQLKNI